MVNGWIHVIFCTPVHIRSCHIYVPRSTWAAVIFMYLCPHERVSYVCTPVHMRGCHICVPRFTLEGAIFMYPFPHERVELFPFLLLWCYLSFIITIIVDWCKMRCSLPFHLAFLYLLIKSLVICVRVRVAQWVRSLDYLATHASLSPIRRGFAPGFVSYKNGAFESQPQVIKLTYCLSMIGGSLRVLRLLPLLKLVAMI